MKSRVVLRVAASGLVLGITLVGCNPSTKQMGVASASSEVPVISDAAMAPAARAAMALKGRDSALAITAAEEAVSADPRNGAYRTLLAQSYLAGGRLTSAETTFDDALTLDPADGRAVLGLALVQIALGKSELALTTLRNSVAPVSDADRGLALALAGETRAALDVLESAARARGANAKTRQNLALVYALAGKWSESRAIAAQDVSSDELNRRMIGWISFSRPQNSWDQVASLMGFTAVEDAGQPERLALAPLASGNTALASAEPAPEVVPQSVTVQEAVLASAEAQAPVSSYQQISFAPRQEIVQAIPARETPLVHAITAPARSFVRPAVAVRPLGGGRFVVQLGAYSTAGRAEAAWNKAVDSFDYLGRYTPTSSTYRNGSAELHRVAVGGFQSWNEASQVCGKVKARGGSCFVRAASSEAPAQWVQRASSRLASR